MSALNIRFENVWSQIKKISGFDLKLKTNM